jgi:hypothetical protein
MLFFMMQIYIIMYIRPKEKVLKIYYPHVKNIRHNEY